MWIRVLWGLRLFHSSGTGRPMRLRSGRPGGRGSRGSLSGSTYLLDKFVKNFSPNGSLIVRTPFNVKVRGSYFDKSNNVDRIKNKRVSEEIFGEIKEKSSSTSKESTAPDIDETSLHGAMIQKLSQTLESVLDPPATLLPKSNPLHLLIYGRLHHRIDSYSIMNAGQASSHVYLTDANTFLEAESMLTQHVSGLDEPSSLPPDALFTLLVPSHTSAPVEGRKLKEILENASKGDSPGENETLASTFKIYAAKHILDANNNGIKTVFLIPTIMSKIYLQGEGSSNLELDSSLIHKVDSVGLHTEFGNINVRDLSADEIRLASQMGDIICEGSLDGHVVAETNHDGDFLASSVDGPSLLVNTDDGDINVLGCVNSDVSQFYTRNGHIYVRYLSNQVYMLVREAGSISATVEEGFLTAVVKTGSIQLRIDSLSADSSLQVENGEITLKVRKDRNFRISAIAQHTNFSPIISNQGELSINEETRHETFVIEPGTNSSSHLPAPVLKIEVLQGTLNLSLIPEDEESSSKKSETRKGST